MLAALFGVPVQILDTESEKEIHDFCDRPMFSIVRQGKQVFSFRPQQRAQHVFLGAPTDTRPEDCCHALMAQKGALLEHINMLLSFEPAQQVDQLPDMELRISLLAAFCKLVDLTGEVDPQSRSRLLRFLLEAGGAFIPYASRRQLFGSGHLVTTTVAAAPLSLGTA